MTLIGFIILLIVAGLCGAVGRAIAGGTRGGLLVSIALGFIGALIGTFIARAARLPEIFAVRVGGESFPVIWSILGGAIFVAVLQLVSGGWRKR